MEALGDIDTVGASLAKKKKAELVDAKTNNKNGILYYTCEFFLFSSFLLVFVLSTKLTTRTKTNNKNGIPYYTCEFFLFFKFPFGFCSQYKTNNKNQN